MSLYQSYMPNYFSIHDILATQEKVPCKFGVQVKYLGFLDPGSDKRDIEIGTSIELPFWMASVLNSQRPAIAEVGLPKIFKEAYRDIMKADPCVVDLHKLAQYFYEFGMSLCMLRLRESSEISNVLVESFKQRFRQILDWAQHSTIEVAESKKLDNTEKMMYQIGREVGSSLHLWLTEGGALITAADMNKLSKSVTVDCLLKGWNFIISPCKNVNLIGVLLRAEGLEVVRLHQAFEKQTIYILVTEKEVKTSDNIKGYNSHI